MADFAAPSAAEAGDTPLPPLADLPSGPPVPSPSLPSAKPPRPMPLGAVLTAVPSNVDAFVARLSRCLSTPSGIDTVMLFLCFTSRFSASVLSSLSHSILRRSARDWIALVASLPPRTTVFFAGPAPVAAAATTTATVVASSGTPSTAAAAAALVLAQRLKALSSLLSEARMILRLWALLGMYSMAKGLVRKSFAASSSSRTTEKGGQQQQQQQGFSSRLDATLAWTRLALCVALQSLENGAYLSQRGVLGWSPRQQGLAYKWSARFWAAFVGIELGQLLAQGLGPRATYAQAAAGETIAWRKKLARTMAWMPLTIHWSTDKGIVSEPWVGFLASIPGIIQMRDLWAENA